MRTGNALKYANKIFNFVTELSESESSIYDKTRDKLEEISKLCNDIKQIIDEKLESVQPRGSEKNLRKNNNKAHKQANQTKSTGILSSVSETVHIPDKYNSAGSASAVSCSGYNTKSNKNYITISDSKKVLHIYANTLKKAADKCHNNAVLDKTCKTVWHWFDSRILNRSKNCKYRFDVRNLQNYIAGFIVNFGYHIEQKDFDEYIGKIEEWINTDDKYIFPYEVKEICNDMNYCYANATSLALWHGLCEFCGYDRLGDIKISTFRIPDTSTAVYDIISTMEDSAGYLGIYTNKYAESTDNKATLLQNFCIV